MELSKIYISNPYEENKHTNDLYDLTVENVTKMYPNTDVWSSFKEDYRQKELWVDIFNNKDKLDVVCVVTSGHIFLEPGKTWELVKEQVQDKTWWAIGHMLDRTVSKGTYLRMFNSCYFINVKEMKDHIRWEDGPGNHYDQVYPGFRPNGGIGSTPWSLFERSTGNHHDDYTPHWIKGAEGVYDYHSQGLPFVRLKEHGGSVLIHEGFNQGITFESFNQDVRDSKEYCYMEMDNMDDATWYDMARYISTKTIPNTEEDDNYWWFYRHFHI
jgi:hypothetical protein